MGASRENDFDVIVIGAGFAGLYALYRLRGLGLRVHVYERGDDVGGTWYWNRYPGARCDVESMYYSYSFSAELEQEWEWTELFPAQPEILRYAGHVADLFDLRRDITFGASVSAATFGADANRWTVETAGGSQVTASFLVTAVGFLSESRVPQFPGLDSFRGSTYHTGRWPHEGADLAGQRVGVIGTGSSGIQAIPVIAAQAEHVTVFQRTAELARRWERGGTSFMTTFSDTSTSEAANEVAAGFVRDRIREIVRDPQTAELLVPRDYPIGTKRICLDTD